LEPPLLSLLTPDSPASPNADDMQAIYVVMLIVAAAFAIAVNAALVVAALRFRARRGRAPVRRTAARRTIPRVSAALGALALVVFVLGVIYTESAREAEPSGAEGLQAASARFAQTQVQPPPSTGDAETLSINAVGQQWLWRYEYPPKEADDQTFQPVFSYYELVVPVDTAVTLNVTSTDVLHRWSVPALGGKADAVPGQVNTTWFKAEEEGSYEGASYAYSGPSYPTMRTRVTVVSAEEYESFVEAQQRELSAAQDVVRKAAEAEAAQEGEGAPATEGGAE
jgi:cytochrome c oxidase subunit 2